MESLRRWREKHAITQAQLAADLAIHPSAVSKLEHGAMAPDVVTLYRLARRTEIPVMDLLREAIGHIADAQGGRKRRASPRRTGQAS